MTRQRKLRIEVYDEFGTVRDDDYRADTLAAVELGIPLAQEIPGERMIEAARLAYRHMVGADFHQIVTEVEMYAHNATTTLETQPGLVIITDRYGHTIHLSPTDATFIRQALGPPDEQETP